MLEHLDWLDSGLGVVGEHPRDEVNKFLLGLVLVQNDLPGGRLEDWKVVMRALLFLIQIDVFLGRSAEDLHDLDQLLLRAIAGEDGF